MNIRAAASAIAAASAVVAGRIGKPPDVRASVDINHDMSYGIVAVAKPIPHNDVRLRCATGISRATAQYEAAPARDLYCRVERCPGMGRCGDAERCRLPLLSAVKANRHVCNRAVT